MAIISRFFVAFAAFTAVTGVLGSVIDPAFDTSESIVARGEDVTFADTFHESLVTRDLASAEDKAELAAIEREASKNAASAENVGKQAQTIVDGIKAVTKASADLTKIFQSLDSPTKVPRQIAGIVKSLNNIIQSLTRLQVTITAVSNGKTTRSLEARQGPGTLNPEDSNAIVVVLVAFVRVHQILLGAIIGDQGIICEVASIGFPRPGKRSNCPNPIVRPFLTAIQTLEKIVDAVAFGLISIFDQASKAAGRTARKQLNEALSNTVDSYQ